MSPSTHIHRFTLERWLAGELPEVDIQTHLDECPVCRERADALRADRAAFAEEVPYAAFRVEHERRLATRSRPRGLRLWLLGPAVIAAAAVLLLVALPRDPADPTERSKGAAVALTLYGATGAPLASGHTLTPGSRIQLGYDAGEFTFLALVGIDAAGEVSAYFPEHGTRLAPLPAGEEGLFPFGLELDQTRGVERFFLVLADRPEPLVPVLDAARAIAHTDLHRTDRLPLPPGLAQATIWLQKPEEP